MKIFILFILIMLFGCNNNEQQNEQQNYQSKYQEGEIIYLKPDSIKAVIKYEIFKGSYYAVYTDSLKVRHQVLVYNSEIY